MSMRARTLCMAENRAMDIASLEILVAAIEEKSLSRATRFLNRGGGPLSLACHDLVREDVLGSPPWLAVRATAWSDIARPHFTNTRHTMFRVVAGASRRPRLTCPGVRRHRKEQRAMDGR
jgi:hypothetical protein